MSTKSVEFERRIVAYVEAHTPVERDGSLRHRGTAEALVMKGCGYMGGLVHFRTHLKRARRKGLIHGDLTNLIALGPAPPPPVARAEPHVVGPAELKTSARRPQPDPGLVVSAVPPELVDAIVHFDRSAETIRLLADRGLSYGVLTDFAIDIELEDANEPGWAACGPAAKRAVEALWVRGFEPVGIAQTLSLPLPVVESVCGSLGRRKKPREIIGLHIAGYPATAVVRVLGVSLDTVRGTLRRFGFIPRATHPVAGATLRTRVMALHRAGLILPEISALTGETEARLRPVLDAITVSCEPAYRQPTPLAQRATTTRAQALPPACADGTRPPK